MKIKDILRDEEPHISFEVFPPKTDAGYESVDVYKRQGVRRARGGTL